MALSSAANRRLREEAHPLTNEEKLRRGMLFYVIADIIFGVFVFVSYIWLRAYNTAGGWFPFRHMPLPDPAISNVLLLLIVLSGVCYLVAYMGIRWGSRLALSAGLAAATILLLATLILQSWFMGHLPFASRDGSFASIFLLFTGYHIFHLSVGLFLGPGVTNRAIHGRYSRERHVGIIAIGYFWAWMVIMPVIWAIILVVQPPRL